MKATWNNTIIAESDATKFVEGNYYFPAEHVHQQYLVQTDHHSHCVWKGDASYYSLEVNGQTNENAAWYYPHPTKLAEGLKNYVAFWKGVVVSE